MLNQLILGDNLEILKSLPSESVDLCYIDPPFFSNRNYAVIWGDKGEMRSFEDCWDGGIDTYINWMFKRVTEIHRVLKPTGSFYLHCDWHAQAELKVYVLDKIFGTKNFRNTIIWHYYNKYSAGKKCLPRAYDNIFYYGKSELHNPNELRDKREEPVKQLLRENINGVLKNKKGADGKVMYRIVDDKKSDDVWKIACLQPAAKEMIGYPTQKPEILLERIVKMGSNEGDTVLDCFMGGGTTIAVAQKLGRNWIGIDQSPSAFGVTRERILAISKPLFPIEFEAKTAKWDWDNLRKMDDFEFEKLCVKTLGGEPTKQAKGGDLGKDGILNNWSVISVKRSENIGRNVADNLRSAILRFRREKNIAKQKDNLEFTLQHGEKINLANYDGFIIAFSFGKGLKAELAQLEREEGFKILPLTVEDILPVAKRPKVILKVECIKLGESGDYKFIATANTDDNRLIEFFAFKILVKNKEDEYENYAFDNFNKTGIFETELKKGEYKVTATATDEYGLTGNDETELTIKG